MTDPYLKCDVCGKPATSAAIDIVEYPPEFGFRYFEALESSMHYGCELHPPKVTQYNLDGSVVILD